jgi:hypothetical protein
MEQNFSAALNIPQGATCKFLASREFLSGTSGYRIAVMATLEENRRRNLRALAKEAGSSSALAKLAEVSEAQISQWINASKDSRTGKPRGMRPETCRHFEKVTGKPEGWMDAEHPDSDRRPVKAVTSPALQLAIAFDELPETFADGGTKLQFLARLLGLIQERPHLEPEAPSAEPNRPPATHSRKQPGRSRAHSAADNGEPPI